MSTEEIKAKFRWFYEEVFEKGNMGAWDELFSSDFVDFIFRESGISNNA